MASSLVVPHVWVAGTDYGIAGSLATLTDAISQGQGNTPAAGALDYAKLRQTVVQTLTTAVWASLTMDVEDKDLAGGHSTSTNTSRYVVAVAGELQVECGVAFASNATGLRGLRLTVGGIATIQGRLFVPPLTTSVTELALTRTLTCAVGDYIEVQARQDSGGNLATYNGAAESGSFMNVRWVHT